MSTTPHIRIDLSSPVPAYQQIVDTIRAMLVEGTLAPGVVLPPVRRVAMDLGVHFNTVAEAYRVLAAEGWLDLRRRHGATVLERNTPPNADPAALDDFRRRLRGLVAEVLAKGAAPTRVVRELRTQAEGLER
jgi:DNA-binding transcriptional regulator YhcF (GntR family)